MKGGKAARRPSPVMLQVVAPGEADIRAGRVTPQEKVFADLRRYLSARCACRKRPAQA